MNGKNIESRPVQLGKASASTRGAKGYSTDLVREIPSVGISND